MNKQFVVNSRCCQPEEKEQVMAVIKVIEIIAESNKSWEDAAAEALKEASKSVRNIKSIYVQAMQAVVENNKIARYRVDTKLSFLVEK
jgi:flavin-binding protein dodecin